MTTDLCFISHTAQTDAHIFFVHGFCDRTGNRSFTGSRRAHQTEDRAFSLVCQFAHGKKFHDTLFDIFQSIMTFLKNFPCFFQIIGIHRLFVPRKGKHCLNVTAEYRIFRDIAVCILKAFNLFADLFFYFATGLKLLKLLFELLCIVRSIVFSQFLTDQFQLFTQDIFSLILVYSGFHFLLKVSSDLHDLDLIA